MSAQRRILAATVALALAVAACTDADTGSGDTAPPSTTIDAATVGDGSVSPQPSADDFGRELEPTNDLASPVAAPILSVAADPDSDDRLIVSFEMESHHCHGIEPSVAESDREVIVEVLTAPRPEADVAACDYGIFPYTVAIDLEAPIGERTITPAEPTEPVDLASIDASDEAEDPSGDEVIDASRALVGRHVEDGVEWAIERDVSWRIVSYDGVVDNDAVDAEVRLGFIVERDLITAVEWS